MPYLDFVNQLRTIGYDVKELGDNKVSFQYNIPVGKFKGTNVELGFVIPPDFPNVPPGGPHIKPRILPINEKATTHPEKVLASGPFGNEWEYWSRPFQGWAETNHTVKTYMAHIVNLFETQ